MSALLQTETEINEYWKAIGAFTESQRLSEGRPVKNFYDGPPFATGLPHHGHALASTIKDCIGRWLYQQGYHVPRRWGWDTHGLPIEFKIEEQLGLKTRQQVLDFGIRNYNNACRGIVMTYRSAWKSIIERLGRWVDMDNDYKTMDPEFMNSVWWVFGQLYQKGLIYRGYKVCPYSMGCSTPLSNFEAKSNYKDVHDWSITVKFAATSINAALLVWTTTPWTLPTNMLLCVNPNLSYLFVEYEDTTYVLAESCVTNVFGTNEVKILQKVTGQYLEGMTYKPLFDYYDSYRERGSFQVVCDDYVKSEEGTGIVHCSPANGEDDYRVFCDQNIIAKTELPPCPLDDGCCFTEPVRQWKGVNVKDAEPAIIEYLSDGGHIFCKKNITHSYPYCWRSNTPLIYRVWPSWFVAVESFRDKMVSNNLTTNWVPSHIRDNRFGNWLQGATDWCISRNRFWGTPIPIWASNDMTEMVCVRSAEELERLAGLKPGTVIDMHRDHIDHITIPGKDSSQSLRRIGDVFDCWFESGSMPYAQAGYTGTGDMPPPADFIVEGLDQTRGWFYTLLVLGTALNDTSPYKNVVVNGIVLSSDGEKMSKSKGNYPPLHDVLTNFGADALRLYLIDSPGAKGGDIRFQESGIQNIVRRYHIMIQNVVKFYFELIEYYEKTTQTRYRLASVDSIGSVDGSLDILDNWIFQCLNQLFEEVHDNMKQYKLNGIVAKFFKFIDQLSRWYMNLSKNRIKSCQSTIPLDVIGNCLYYFSMISAPFSPFLAESIYQKIKPLSPDLDLPSIHYTLYPTKSIWKSDGYLLYVFDHFATLVDIVRGVRLKRDNSSAKLALPSVTIVAKDKAVLDSLRLIEKYIHVELNVDRIYYNLNVHDYVVADIKPDVKKIKDRISDGRTVGAIIKYFKTCGQNHHDYRGGRITLPAISNISDGLWLEEDELIVNYLARDDSIICKDDLAVMVDTSVNDDIMSRYYAKMFWREYQQARKEAGLVISDEVVLKYSCDAHVEQILSSYITNKATYIGLRCVNIVDDVKFKKVVDIGIGKVTIYLM